jgi:hypothetical protein
MNSTLALSLSVMDEAFAKAEAPFQNRFRRCPAE